MPKYSLKVTVEYIYDVRADSKEEARELGHDYEDYQHSGDIYDIKVEEYEDDCTCDVIHDPSEDCEEYDNA